MLLKSLLSPARFYTTNDVTFQRSLRNVHVEDLQEPNQKLQYEISCVAFQDKMFDINSNNVNIMRFVLKINLASFPNPNGL